MKGAEVTDSEGPLEVGPYRMLERIGAGGMGEVFLATDDRLGRRVAIKRLRPDRDRGSELRERLRREARYTAGLAHPAIVQVFDVLEQGDDFYLVMEWIDGENLRRRVEHRGRLEIEEVIRLGRQLAAGLAAAHRHGIVHRDFKAENVLVDGAGQVKITDFGIAKQLVRAADDETLTDENGLLGTYRVLSPEQALGEPVDPRSDLFSFGVLLYETLTGSSPFGEANNVETLRRIVETEPTPMQSLRPETPPSLASLVGRLLAKEPHLRPRSAREVELDLAELEQAAAGPHDEQQTLYPQPGEPDLSPPASSTPDSPAPDPPTVRRRPASLWMAAAVAVVAAAVLWWAAGGARWNELAADDEPPIYVAATKPSLRLDASLAPGAGGAAEVFSEAVRVAVIRTLVGLGDVSAKAPAEIDRAEGGPLEVARSVAADEVVTASILWRSELARVTLDRTRVTDGVVLWSDSFDTATDDLVLVMRAVAGLVGAAYPHHARRPDMPGLDVEPADLRRLLELRRRFIERRDPSGEETLAGLEALRASSPDFVDVDLQIVEIALHRFYDSRDPAHLERAERAIERAQRLAPADPRVLRHRVHIELEAGRPAAAGQALESLAAALPGDLQVDDMRARLLRKQGRAAEALELLRRVTRLQPSTRRLVTVARLETDLGEIDAARSHLRLALERSPADFEVLSLLAQLELTVGDPGLAAELYGRLVARSAGTSELSNLGLALMLLGRYQQAAEHFARAAEIEPRNPFFLLNLADARWIAGDREAALEAYRGVIERVRADAAADRPQFLTVKAQALAHLGERRQAVSAVQQALARAPESASVAYEAALVYAVVGERISALVQAEAALQRGVEPRWFDFPWFDELRRSADFRALLEGAVRGPAVRDPG